MNAAQAARISYLLTLVWLIAWMVLLPEPAGKRLGWFAAIAIVPMLLVLPSIWKKQARGMIWGGYLVILYFMLGVTEWWTIPEQRPVSALFVGFCVLYLVALGFATRKRRNKG